MKIKRIFWKLRIIWLAIQWIPQTNLGDKVWYQGKEYMVCNGVRAKSWRLGDFDNGDNGWVRRSECRKVKSLANYWHSFQSGYQFYMTSWFGIWTKQGIKDWMQNCNIWPGT